LFLPYVTRGASEGLCIVREICAGLPIADRAGSGQLAFAQGRSTGGGVVAAGIRSGGARYGDASHGLPTGGAGPGVAGCAGRRSTEDVRVDNGVLALRKAGKWLSWSSKQVKDIPDFLLFLALVDHLRRAAAVR
jgi:hypothetical protein